MPDQGDVAQRRLAEIWSSHQGSAEQTQSPGADANPVRGRHEALIVRLGDELAEHSRKLGPIDPQTVDARVALGVAQLDGGHVTDAVPLLEHAINTIDPADAAAAGRLATAKAALARAYLKQRRVRLAIGLYESLLSDTSGVSTEEQRWGYRTKLAVAHRAGGNGTAAIDQLEGLVAELDGRDDARVHLVDALVELATTHVVTRGAADGVQLYERALPLAIEVHGAEHRTTLSVRLLLAEAHQQANESTQAIGTYEQLISDAELALGPHDKLSAQAQSELTVLLRARS
jgi:tetratricopeptide (TPR) repeat protein